jgi:hypothetical protein
MEKNENDPILLNLIEKTKKKKNKKSINFFDLKEAIKEDRKKQKTKNENKPKRIF